MTDIIVTDLTRFGNREYLCLAGLTHDGQHCIRPLRDFNGRDPAYLTYAECRDHTILPGTILRADYRRPLNVHAPHSEDSVLTSQIQILGPASSEEFRTALDASAVNTVSAGFGIDIPHGDKFLSPGAPPARSIITLKVAPWQFRVVVDGYDNTKVRAHVTDADGKSFRYLSITDLGFYDYVGNPDTRRVPASQAEQEIHGQQELYLRLGLGRLFKAKDGREGYWLQVNGIYTFPNYNLVLRQY